MNNVAHLALEHGYFGPNVPYLPIGSVRSGVLPLPVSDCSEKRIFRRLKVAFELGSSSAM